MRAARRVIMYLYNTRHLRIVCRRPDKLGEQNVPVVHERAKHLLDIGLDRLQVFADSDYAGDETRKSTYGKVIMIMVDLSLGPPLWEKQLPRRLVKLRFMLQYWRSRMPSISNAY